MSLYLQATPRQQHSAGFKRAAKMAEKSKIKTKNWRDNSKNHPLRFPFLHLYKQEIKIFQDYFFSVSKPSELGKFFFFLVRPFFLQPV